MTNTKSIGGKLPLWTRIKTSTQLCNSKRTILKHKKSKDHLPPTHKPSMLVNLYPSPCQTSTSIFVYIENTLPTVRKLYETTKIQYTQLKYSTITWTTHSKKHTTTLIIQPSFKPYTKDVEDLHSLIQSSSQLIA